jgi:hypothetical protein
VRCPGFDRRKPSSFRPALTPLVETGIEKTKHFTRDVLLALKD